MQLDKGKHCALHNTALHCFHKMMTSHLFLGWLVILALQLDNQLFCPIPFSLSAATWDSDLRVFFGLYRPCDFCFGKLSLLCGIWRKDCFSIFPFFLLKREQYFIYEFFQIDIFMIKLHLKYEYATSFIKTFSH